ncbi:ATP-binding cassette sub-family C member 10 [Maniola hyperantus]|uniref:ATP-binding cassette sub-family C member 10 n=1 Tax=Aphantopus hyperantus TaxID=2795564 RepID=UPI001568B82C|nr:multidrug resistance-associated protein 7 [Maniola hyperantus]
MNSFMNLTWKWEYMCGPQGLIPWNDTTKDIGMCFQELFFQIPIYFIFAITSAYYVGLRKDWVVREKTQERSITLRSFVALALFSIPIIHMYIIISDDRFRLYPIDYFAAGAACISWLVHFGYVIALKHRLGQSSRGPISQLVLWSLTVLFSIIELRSNILTGAPTSLDIAILCCHFVYFLTLLPASDSRPTFYSPCLVGSQHSHSEYTPLLPQGDEGVLGTAMQGANWWSKLCFTWVDPLLQKGFENKLQDLEEVYDIPARYRCTYVGARMDKALIGNVDNYQQFTEVPHEPFIGPGYGATSETYPQSSTPVTPTSRVLLRPIRRQNVSLFRALHSCFALQFYGIGILKLISDMAGFGGPILLNKLVTFVEDDSIDQHYGYIYAATLLAVTIISALFNVHFTWLMSMIGLKMRGAIVSTILRKTLSVTSTELNKAFSIGEITNFMSTDTDRIVNSCPSFHALWSIPLQLFITLFLLYQQVGISFLAGVAFSVILIPINKIIANKIGQLSTEMMKHKDTRVSLISDMLRGIRTVKVHVWEDYFIDKVSEARARELRYLRGRKYLDAVCVVLWATTPVLVAALTLGTHALRGQVLSAPTVFTTIALINMLIAPLNAFPWVLNGLTEAWVSIKRIQKLLDLRDMDMEHYYDRLNTNRDEDKVIIIKNASFTWAKSSTRRKSMLKSTKNKGKSQKKLTKYSIQRRDSESSNEALIQEPFKLQDIFLEIGKEELVGIAGPVGSGKTSLLLAIIGDMLKQAGDIQIPEFLNSFGYVSQQPWLVRGTIRDNILFGKPYDESKFRSVIDACALTEDLNLLGWNAYVGEGGCTLSGGQRARISLARAVYQDKQVYLLDDVLSGIDATVAQHIMQRCILGLLRHTARALVTHSPRHLARAHRVLLLQDGRIVAQGPPETVLNEIEEFLPSETECEGEEPPPKRDTEDKQLDELDVVSRNSLDNDESMSEGTVGWWVIGLYLRSVGSFLTTCIVISLILMQLSQNFTFVWLTFWVRNKSNNSVSVPIIDNVHENTTALDHSFNVLDNIVHKIVNTSMTIINNLNGNNNSTINTDNYNSASNMYSTQSPVLKASAFTDNYYLEVYFGLAGLNLVFTIMRAFLFAYGGVKAAAKIHKILLKVIVKANVKFFDVTPTGRIVNRFSSDTYTVDDSLPFILNILLAQIFSLIGAVVVTVYGLPWLLVGVLPMTFIYYRLQRRYRITSRQLKRLQSVALSPVYVHFNDTLEGLSSIRALGAAARWAERGEESVERWQRAALCGAAAAQWLALRLQGAAAAAVAGAALVAVLQRATHAADPGLVGLAISYALSMTSMLSSVLNSFTETEREMIAVERVGEYITQVESEKSDGDSPPYGWPSHGVISFEDVHLKYGARDSGEALRGVTFSSHPGERLAVVGRTGAGKSSLLRAVLRLAPCAAGRVRVDGIDVATLHLQALRSRIGIIPQEPFIFSGSIRENVDPLRQYLDAEVWRALDACGARAVVSARGGLAAPAEQLSRGHAQVLCLVRALLQKAKILLVDEATANLDQESERVILDTIRCSFGGSTVVFVAHRLAGVLECSRVLVLGGGRLLELRPPEDALADPTSHLYRLLHPDQ